MSFKVYIIYSVNKDIFYKGMTSDLTKRIDDHNRNLSNYTKNKGPWSLVFYRTFLSKAEALKYERMIKRQNRKYIEWLLSQEFNELKN